MPALLAVVLVMFSLESRPRPLAQGLPADVVFAGPTAVLTTGAIVEAARDRRAGNPGDRAAARLVIDALRGHGFTVELDRFSRGSKDLVNVIGRRAGRSRRQIVVVAARDAAGVPDAAGSAADTAALMELARVFEGRPSRKTLVLASVDGSALGEIGTERLAGRDRLARPRGRRDRDVRPGHAVRRRACGGADGRTTRAARTSGSSARRRSRSGRSSARWRLARAPPGSSRGSPSPSGSALRACCSTTDTTPCASPARGSYGGSRADARRRRSTRIGSAASGAPRCAR